MCTGSQFNQITVRYVPFYDMTLTKMQFKKYYNVRITVPENL